MHDEISRQELNELNLEDATQARMSSSPPVQCPAAGATQSAIIQDATGKPTIAHGAPVPTLRPGEVLVKVVAVALKPSDYKMGAAFPCPGASVGGDFSGRVVGMMPGEELYDSDGDGGDLEANTTTTTTTTTAAHRPRVGVGDMVCGQVHDSNPADPGTGSFAEYVRAPVDLVLRVPDAVDPAAAATMGGPLLTSCLSLWGSLGLPASPAHPVEGGDGGPVLVYGGSTATGAMAIQLLKL